MIFNPAHPGEVLKDYLGGMTVKEAAARLRVTRATLSRILNRHAGITAGMSLRLSAALGTSPDFWLKMQGQYDLWHAKKITYLDHAVKKTDDCWRQTGSRRSKLYV